MPGGSGYPVPVLWVPLERAPKKERVAPQALVGCAWTRSRLARADRLLFARRRTAARSASPPC